MTTLQFHAVHPVGGKVVSYKLAGVKGKIWANFSMFPGGVYPQTLEVVTELAAPTAEPVSPDAEAKAAAALAKAEEKAKKAEARAAAQVAKAQAAATKAQERAAAALAKAQKAAAPAPDATVQPEL